MCNTWHNRGLRVIGLAIAITVLFQLVVLVTGGNPLTQGRLFDPDCYARVDRVLELMTHGRWYDASQPSLGAPGAVVLNWTRPLDILIIIGAYPLSMAIGVKAAIFAWGSLISPLLLMATVAAFAWGTRPFLTAGQFLLATALIFVLPRFFGIYLLGRPDHHSLLAFLFVVQLSIFYRILAGEVSRSRMLLAGVVAGVALWVSVETLLSLLYFSIALGILTILKRECIRWTTSFLIGLAIALVISLLCEVPVNTIGVPVYSRFSIVHAYLGAAAVLSFGGFAALAEKFNIDRSIAGRTVLVITSGIAAGLAIAWAYPAFFAGPLVGYDPAIANDWQATVDEMSSALPTTVGGARIFFSNIGPALVALPMAGILLRSGDARLSAVMALTLLGTVIYLPMTLFEMRWAAYLQPVMLLPLTLTVVAAMSWDVAVRVRSWKIPLRAAPGALAIAGPALASALVSHVAQADTSLESESQCPWDAAFSHLALSHPSDWPGAIVFADEFIGPELAWRTGARVIASPHIDSASGISDVLAVMRSHSPDQAAAIMSRRQIDYVLLCRAHDPRGGEFVRELVEGRPPTWLEPVQLPDQLDRYFRLFRRNPGAVDQPG